METNQNEDNATGSSTHTSHSFRLFQDENLVSFFRRLGFTNDGALLVTPAGVYKQTNDDNDMETDEASNHGDSTSKNETQNTIYVYARNSVTQQPVAFFGNYSKAAIAIKCSPIKYQLRSKNGITKPSRFALPYRMVFAVATQDSVFVYDTQQSKPLCMLSGMHYASITDISWSSDGNVLMLTSNDGYCSVAVYDKEELGLPYEGEAAHSMPDAMENVPDTEVMAVKATTPEPVRPLTVLDTWTRKVEPVTAAALVASNANQDNKRRITPTLVETKPSDENQQQKKKRRIAPTLISSL
ncbi:Chromatin assembly factor 1 subunit [Umbelopsis sp. WA50703]